MSDGPPTVGESSGAAVRGYNVPGRKPDSQVPYEFFLGNAAHRLVYGGWVAQAVEGMVRRSEELATFSGAVGVVIEIAGNVATGFFSGAIFGRMGSSPGAQQPPAQGGGQVIPFPSRPPPTAPPAQVPAAAGMSLSR